MAEIAPYSSSQAASAAERGRSETEGDASTLSGDLQTFLKLLTTQLQSQDPLNPTDSTEFVTQLAMFSQAEQSVNTNRKLDSLIELTSSQMLSSASSFIGKDVLAATDSASFDGESPVRFSYDVPSGYPNVAIEVRDSAGRVVRSIEGRAEAGRYDDSWDGRTDAGRTAAEGDYSVHVTARQDAEAGVAQSRRLETSIAGRVTEMRVSDGKVMAVIGGREVALDDIAGISGTSDS
jgi:flagellar basal-body rod modification protein FlgD